MNLSLRQQVRFSKVIAICYKRNSRSEFTIVTQIVRSNAFAFVFVFHVQILTHSDESAEYQVNSKSSCSFFVCVCAISCFRSSVCDCRGSRSDYIHIRMTFNLICLSSCLNSLVRFCYALLRVFACFCLYVFCCCFFFIIEIRIFTIIKENSYVSFFICCSFKS